MPTFMRFTATKSTAAIVVAVLGLTTAGYMLQATRHSHADAPREDVASPPLTASEEQALSQANALSQAFRAAADRALPAVVSIQHTIAAKVVKRDGLTRGKSPFGNRQMPPGMEDLNPLFKRFFEELPNGEGMPDMESPAQASSGSGVIIDAAGIVLTNNHVVAGGGKIVVRLHDGREFEATDVKTDPNTDIAVLRIKCDGPLPAAKLGNSDEMRVGDWVLALGQPFGLQDTVTAGIISAKGRDINITRHAEFLQTDAAINPGNSGGPLVDLRGAIIGVNTAISSRSGGNQGVGFAVPVNVAKWVSSQLLKDGRVHRAYLGVGIQPVSQELAEQLGMKTAGGALVTDVLPGSPAAEAGVKSQDVIVELAGQPVQSHSQLYAITGRTPIGSPQKLTLVRDGKRLELNITLREQPSDFGARKNPEELGSAAPPQSQEIDGLGLEVSPLTAETAKQLGLREPSGVVITSVAEQSLADRAGLTTGMAIVQVGRQPVHNVAEFQAAIKGVSLTKGLLLLIRTAEGSRFVVLKS